LQHIWQIFAKEIKMSGFLVMSLLGKWSGAFYQEMPRLVAEGKIKYQEDRSVGLEKVGEAFIEVQKGKNQGKKVVIVADE
jgi:NADPH-dependent curcumin reductase CurA